MGSDMTNLKAGRSSNATESRERYGDRERDRADQDEQVFSISKTFLALQWRIG